MLKSRTPFVRIFASAVSRAVIDAVKKVQSAQAFVSACQEIVRAEGRPHRRPNKILVEDLDACPLSK